MLNPRACNFAAWGHQVNLSIDRIWRSWCVLERVQPIVNSNVHIGDELGQSNVQSLMEVFNLNIKISCLYFKDLCNLHNSSVHETGFEEDESGVLFL